jgi:hypothetical protein
MICSSRRDSNLKCQSLSEIPTASAAGAQIKAILIILRGSIVIIFAVLSSLYNFFFSHCALKRKDN